MDRTKERVSYSYSVLEKSGKVLIYFELLEKTILYLQQTYYNTFVVFKGKENVFPPLKERAKDATLIFLNQDLSFEILFKRTTYQKYYCLEKGFCDIPAKNGGLSKLTIYLTDVQYIIFWTELACTHVFRIIVFL